MSLDERSLTITWDDPLALAAEARGLSGLDFLSELRDRRLPGPPVAALIGFDVAEVEAGRVVFQMQPGEHHYNPIGTVHGGVIATLLDSAMGCSVHSALPRGRAYTTLEIKVNYVRAVTAASGLLRAEAKVVNLGQRVATAEARLVDAAGRLCSHATTTCLVFDLPPS